MASTSREHPYPEATYYDSYSDPENGGSSYSPSRPSDQQSDGYHTPQPAAKKRKLVSPTTQSNGSPNNFESRASTNYVAAPPLPLPPATPTTVTLEPSILNVEPRDELLTEVAEWIAKVARGYDYIEVEAKVGILKESRGDTRITLPVLSETILQEVYPVRFEASMAPRQHAHINSRLNELLELAAAPRSGRARITYAHKRTVDSFYNVENHERIRVSVDEATGEMRECVVKRKIAHLNVFCPKRKTDYRISVSTEEPRPRPSGEPSMIRRKDRVTYTHQIFQIDLTQVTASNPGQAPQPPTHELEVEFRHSKELMRVLAKNDVVTKNEEFVELVRVFVNNIRILVRNCI